MVAMKSKGRAGRTKSRGPTGADVARVANVSPSTVSRTFTSGTSVDPMTRARVVEAAQELGYAPHHAARSLISGRSDTVGLVVASFENPFYHTILGGFLQHFQQQDLRVMCHAALTLGDVETGIRAMLRHNVDGMIVAASGITSDAVEECRRLGVPVVLFNRSLASSAMPTVQTDNVGGGRAMAELLLRGGHTRMAFVNGVEQSSTNRDRLAGFCAALEEAGVAPPVQEYGDYTYEGGREAAKRLMIPAERPDAIFCANDIMACGVLDAVRHDLGYRVPEDVGVTGFDDIPMAAWPSFGLTTIRQRRNQMVEAAIGMLEDLLDRPGTEPRTVLIEGRLIVRESVRLRPA